SFNLSFLLMSVSSGLHLVVDTLVFIFIKFHDPASSPSRIHLHSHYFYSFNRTNSVLTKLLLASPNSPLQYPMQGFTVRPLTSTPIPGMVHSLQLYQGHIKLKVLVNSIRMFYDNISIIIADDSFEPQKMTGEHIQHYIMPPAQGWFAGRNLAVSQVTTKYFLWVDDDFVFTKDTKIEQLVEVMEAVPELDLGGTVHGAQFYFSLIYDEGNDKEGGCLYRRSREKYHHLPGHPQCVMVSGVINFFLARTDAVQRVGFDPKLQRVAHSEFFMDGLGSLMVASCNHVSIGHQQKNGKSGLYSKYRHPSNSDQEFKYQLHFFKNNLKCILFG
uniref:Glycosyltransferase 2-like domain-containing protein n=1 Tax=Sphaeramia orbicularis TaxID=375764 RepID=A0A673BD55_9TELE